MHRTRLQYIMIVVSVMLMLVSWQGHAEPRDAQRGEASWYGKRFNGRKTANGGDFIEQEMAPRGGPAGAYYRVRVGPFAMEEEAKQVAKALQREGHRIFLDEIPASAVPPQAPGATTAKAIEAKKKPSRHSS